jgi:hypothetical protein
MVLWFFLSLEAMLWLEGKRALAVGAEIRDQNLRVNAA